MYAHTPDNAKALAHKDYYETQSQAQSTAPKQSQSEQALERIAKITSMFDECRNMAAAAGERILGPVPQEVVGGIEGLKGNQNGFMNSLDEGLARLERIGNLLRDDLGRVVRAF